jgi:hypothetical protein
MNEQQPNPPTPNKLRQIVDKVLPILKGIWLKFTQTKFYQNKKIFLPVSISMGLLFFVILIGLIFGGKKTSPTVITKPSPSPTSVQSSSVPGVGTDALSQIEQKLIDIKNQIIELDVKQSRLQPPTLNFKIEF